MGNIRSLIRAVLLPVALLAAAGAHGAGYESLLEQGVFYLERGATYGADAVRALEKARETEPERAAVDPRFLEALARGYVLTARYTEAFWALEALGRQGKMPPEGEELRTRILAESGLGRLRLVSAFPLSRVKGRLAPQAEGRLDVAARKILERLNELIARGFDVGQEGLTILVPEGRFLFACEGSGLYDPREPSPLEVWAGDETSLRLVPVYPDPGAWKIASGNRGVTLSWPPLEGATYELVRDLGGQRDTVYRGEKPFYEDSGLPVGVRIGYLLRVLGPQGELRAASQVGAETLPPVSRVSAEARLEADLRVSVGWTLGSGTADRVRVMRKGAKGEEALLDSHDRERFLAGTLSDGPYVPAKDRRSLTYRVEVWLGTGPEPVAVAEASVEVPPVIERVSEVVQSIDRGAVIVQWETFPKEGIALGYAVFRQRSEGAEGELVARVDDPFAREFTYPVEDPVKATGWRHFVVPYVGSRYLFDPDALTVQSQGAEEPIQRRAGRGPLPNLVVSWDPYPGSRHYLLRLGEGKEYSLDKNYVEIRGLQNPLTGTTQNVKVLAVDAEGNLIDLVTVDVQYHHYPRIAPAAGTP